MRKYSLYPVLFVFLLIQCSKEPEPEKPAPEIQKKETKQPELLKVFEPISILGEIPEHIQKIENVTIFPGDTEPTHTIELIPEQTFGSTEEIYITNVIGAAEDDNGRVIVKSSGTNYEQILNVFNADGSFHTQLGGRGRGPGEYGPVVDLLVKSGKIYVSDHTSQRLNEYSVEDYSILRSILLETWESKDDFRFGYAEPLSDGNYLVYFLDPPSKFGKLEIRIQVMDDKGTAMPFEPLVFPAGIRIKVGESLRPTMPVNFTGSTELAVSDEDELYVIWTREFLISKYDSEGRYVSSIYYPIQGAPFDLDVYVNSGPFTPNARLIEKGFSDMDEEFPETFPVVQRIKVDDEHRIWLAVPRGERQDIFEWWILKESGELLAKLVRPKYPHIYDIRNGHLYSKQINEETDEEYVVKYRIEWREN